MRVFLNGLLAIIKNERRIEMKAKAKAWIVWNYISSVDGHILNSSIGEFQGSSDELDKETKKRTKEKNQRS